MASNLAFAPNKPGAILERFPVGSAIAIYLVGSERDADSPCGQPVGAGTVSNDGALALAIHPDQARQPWRDSTLVAYALVDGEHRYVRFRASLSAPAPVPTPLPPAPAPPG